MARPDYRLVWSSPAEADLLDLWTYLAHAASADIADNQIRKIHAACRPLLAAPLRGRPRDEVRLGLRSILIRPHVAFYRVTSDRIEIVRVLHEARDIGPIFDEG